MAYVENVAAFVEKSLSFDAGVHVYNYIDKPDYSMNELVSKVDKLLGRKRGFSPRLPYVVGYGLAKIFDGVSLVTGRRFAVSAVRVKKFCSDSVYNSAVSASGFWAPVSLEEALEATVRHEFVENNEDLPVFYSE
jgi:hypothetical protein